MGWTAKVKNSVSYADMTTESAALEYRIDWLMNRPATVTLLVNDDSGAKTQTYGSAYLGKSAILIEQPTNTEIFRGRIVAAEANPAQGTLELRGEDWLGQLQDRLVTYDTRENLGNGYREYTMTPYYRDTTQKNAVWELGGIPRISVSSQDLGEVIWIANAFDDMKLVIPNKYMGSMTERIYAYDETVTCPDSTMDVDTPANGEQNTWKTDAAYHQMECSSDVGEDPIFNVVYDFHTLAADSNRVNKLVSLKLHMTVRAYGTHLSYFWVEAYNHTRAAWLIIYEYAPTGGNTPMTEDITLEIDPTNVYASTDYGTDAPSDWMTAAGEMDVRLTVDNRTGFLNETLKLRVDELYWELNYTVNSAPPNSVYTIDATTKSAGNYLQVTFSDNSPFDDDVIDDWPFHITDKITSYVTDIVTTYDILYALDASSDVTASTNYYGRHYHQMTTLDILNDLRIRDGTDFWLNPWDGDSLDLVWNSTYGGAAAATYTDSSVLHWLKPRQALADIVNEWIVEGFTWQDDKAAGSDTDAASIASYGRRSALINNPDIGSDAEAAALADAAVDRTKTLPIHVSAVLNGYSTVALGSYVVINSTKLGLANQDYVVTRKLYDSAPATTTMFFTPKQNMLNPEPHLDLMMVWVQSHLTALDRGQERGSRYTDIWS